MPKTNINLICSTPLVEIINNEEVALEPINVLEEFRRIISAIHLSQRDVVVDFNWGSIENFFSCVNQSVDLVVYSGHATRNGCLICEQINGIATQLSSDELIRVWKGESRVGCLILNACHSQTFAEPLLAVGLVQAAIVVRGDDVLLDAAAQCFSQAFILALLTGATYSDAFAHGRWTCLHTERLPFSEIDKFILLLGNDASDEYFPEVLINSTTSQSNINSTKTIQNFIKNPPPPPLVKVKSYIRGSARPFAFLAKGCLRWVNESNIPLSIASISPNTLSSSSSSFETTPLSSSAINLVLGRQSEMSKVLQSVQEGFKFISVAGLTGVGRHSILKGCIQFANDRYANWVRVDASDLPDVSKIGTNSVVGVFGATKKLLSPSTSTDLLSWVAALLHQKHATVLLVTPRILSESEMNLLNIEESSSPYPFIPPPELSNHNNRYHLHDYSAGDGPDSISSCVSDAVSPHNSPFIHPQIPPIMHHPVSSPRLPCRTFPIRPLSLHTSISFLRQLHSSLPLPVASQLASLGLGSPSTLKALLQAFLSTQHNHQHQSLSSFKQDHSFFKPYDTLPSLFDVDTELDAECVPPALPSVVAPSLSSLPAPAWALLTVLALLPSPLPANPFAKRHSPFSRLISSLLAFRALEVFEGGLLVVPALVQAVCKRKVAANLIDHAEIANVKQSVAAHLMVFFSHLLAAFSISIRHRSDVFVQTLPIINLRDTDAPARLLKPFTSLLMQLLDAAVAASPFSPPALLFLHHALLAAPGLICMQPIDERRYAEALCLAAMVRASDSILKTSVTTDCQERSVPPGPPSAILRTLHDLSLSEGWIPTLRSFANSLRQRSALLLQKVSPSALLPLDRNSGDALLPIGDTIQTLIKFAVPSLKVRIPCLPLLSPILPFQPFSTSTNSSSTQPSQLLSPLMLPFSTLLLKCYPSCHYLPLLQDAFGSVMRSHNPLPFASVAEAHSAQNPLPPPPPPLPLSLSLPPLLSLITSPLLSDTHSSLQQVQPHAVHSSNVFTTHPPGGGGRGGSIETLTAPTFIPFSHAHNSSKGGRNSGKDLKVEEKERLLGRVVININSLAKEGRDEEIDFEDTENEEEGECGEDSQSWKNQKMATGAAGYLQMRTRMRKKVSKNSSSDNDGKAIDDSMQIAMDSSTKTPFSLLNAPHLICSAVAESLAVVTPILQAHSLKSSSATQQMETRRETLMPVLAAACRLCLPILFSRKQADLANATRPQQEEVLNLLAAQFAVASEGPRSLLLLVLVLISNWGPIPAAVLDHAWHHARLFPSLQRFSNVREILRTLAPNHELLSLLLRVDVAIFQCRRLSQSSSNSLQSLLFMRLGGRRDTTLFRDSTSMFEGSETGRSLSTRRSTKKNLMPRTLVEASVTLSNCVLSKSHYSRLSSDPFVVVLCLRLMKMLSLLEMHAAALAVGMQLLSLILPNGVWIPTPLAPPPSLTQEQNKDAKLDPLLSASCATKHTEKSFNSPSTNSIESGGGIKKVTFSTIRIAPLLVSRFNLGFSIIMVAIKMVSAAVSSSLFLRSQALERLLQFASTFRRPGNPLPHLSADAAASLLLSCAIKLAQPLVQSIDMNDKNVGNLVGGAVSLAVLSQARRMQGGDFDCNEGFAVAASCGQRALSELQGKLLSYSSVNTLEASFLKAKNGSAEDEDKEGHFTGEMEPRNLLLLKVFIWCCRVGSTTSASSGLDDEFSMRKDLGKVFSDTEIPNGGEMEDLLEGLKKGSLSEGDEIEDLLEAFIELFISCDVETT